MTKTQIVVLGSTNTDMVIRGKKIPKPGETVSGGQFLMNAGGKGANQAVAVARLAQHHGTCAFIGKVGADLFGRETKVRMQREGIDMRLIVDPEVPSGTALILVDAHGQNVISVALGANGTLVPKDIAPCTRLIAQAKVLLMQLETPRETVLAAAEVAHKAGTTVILNPAPAAKLPAALYRLVDWMTPNETEAELLTGVKVKDAATAAKAVAVLQRRGVKNVIITLGKTGCYCSVTKRIHPALRVKAVDCVAAGDTFNGAFAVALAEEMPFEKAIKFAQRASAISVTRFGAQTSIPMREEVL